MPIPSLLPRARFPSLLPREQMSDNCPFRAVAGEIMSRRMEDEKRQKIQMTQVTRGH